MSYPGIRARIKQAHQQRADQEQYQQMSAIREGKGVRGVHSRLTVKLSGRPTPPDQRRGRTLSSSARGA